MNLTELLGTAGLAKADHAQWLAAVRGVLKGATFEEALVSSTDDGLLIQPLYARAADASSHARPKDRRWRILQRIDDPDPVRANAQALEDIAGGADGLALVFEGAPNAFGYGLPATAEALERVLADLPLNRLHLRFDAHPNSRAAAEWLLEFLVRQRADAARLDLSLGIDPAAVFAGSGRLRMSIEALESSLAQSLSHFFGLGIPAVLLEADGRVFHNAGATEAQELGAVLASAAFYLRQFDEARQPLFYAAPHIGFSLSVDQDLMLSIAKIRALRVLWARLLEACSAPPTSSAVHAETSWRMMAARDFENNIVRSTIACFAAAAGGADTISILPHTIAHGLPDPFARRLARNTQLILAEESHVGFVADPALGSGALEAITASLCQAAWDEFRAIEADGGILRSLEAGHVQRRIAEASAVRAAGFAEGRRAIVGATLFPPDQERAAATLSAEQRPSPTDGVVFCQPLAPARLDALPDRAE